MWFTDERGNKVNTENRKPGISANQFHKKEDDVVGVTVEELQHIEENGFTGFDVQEGEKVHVTENIEFHDDFGKNGEIVAVSGEHDGHQVFAILGKAEEGENPVAEIENRVEEQITPKTGEEVPVEQHVSGTVQNEVHYPLFCAFCTFKTDSADALESHKQQTGHYPEATHEKMKDDEHHFGNPRKDQITATAYFEKNGKLDSVHLIGYDYDEIVKKIMDESNERKDRPLVRMMKNGKEIKKGYF